jgi:hypothetical protein
MRKSRGISESLLINAFQAAARGTSPLPEELDARPNTRSHIFVIQRACLTRSEGK